MVACEFSGKIRDAFRAKGHDAWSCDFRSSAGSHFHYQGNVWHIIDERWDLLIAHPPCTRLCNSGVRWLKERNLWTDMQKAAKFFRMLFNAEIPKICIENPIPHKYAIKEIGCKYDQIIQPWLFGHGETKATCLWLRNLPKLKPTNIVSGREHRIHKLSALKGKGSSRDRQKNRSITFQGIANAMAEQWN